MTNTKSGGGRRRIEILVSGSIVASCLLFWYNLHAVPFSAKAFPLTLVTLLGLLAAFIGARAIFRPVSVGLEESKNANWSFFVHIPRFIFTLVIFIAYGVALEPVGFFVSTAVFLVALTFSLGYRKPMMVGVTYGLFLLFVFSIFVAVFDRPLPKDFWLRTSSSSPPYSVALLSSEGK